LSKNESANFIFLHDGIGVVNSQNCHRRVFCWELALLLYFTVFRYLFSTVFISVKLVNVKFSLAVLCEDAWLEGDGNLSLTRVFSRINCGSFPHVHPRMVLACTLSVPPLSQSVRVHIFTELVDSDGRTLARVMDDPEVLVGESDDSHSFSFTMELLNLAFPAEGNYQFSIFMNGSLAQEVPLAIRALM
jgi:hypothetical protein